MQNSTYCRKSQTFMMTSVTHWSCSSVHCCHLNYGRSADFAFLKLDSLAVSVCVLVFHAHYIMCKHSYVLWQFCLSLLEIAPVLLLVLDRAGPELDRTGASPIFGPAPVRYLHFCVAHALKPTMLKRLRHKAINVQQQCDTWHLTVWVWTLHLPPR